MEIDLYFAIISPVFKHSGKIPSDNELLKSIETVGENRDYFSYINTGTFTRSVGMFFRLRIRLTISSLSERVLLGNSMEKYLN